MKTVVTHSHQHTEKERKEFFTNFEDLKWKVEGRVL